MAHIYGYLSAEATSFCDVACAGSWRSSVQKVHHNIGKKLQYNKLTNENFQGYQLLDTQTFIFAEKYEEN